MKKLNKILLTLSLVLCLGGGLLLAIGAWAGGIDDAQEIADVRTQRYEQEKTPLDTFSAIDADLALCSMEIRPSDNDRAYLEYHIDGSIGRAPLHVSVENNVLKLRDENNAITRSNIEQILTGFLWLLPDAEREPYIDGSIILYLPETSFDSVHLELDMGELTVDRLQAAQFTADLAMGSLNLTGTTLGQSKIDLDMGTFTGSALTFNGDNIIELSTGNAELTLSPESNDGLLIDATTDIGDISAPESLGGNLLDTDDVVANHYRRTPQGTPTGNLSINAEMGKIIFH